MKRFLIVLLLMAGFPFAHKEEVIIKREEVQKISYPSIVKIHPPVVHFGIALPVFTVILQIFYVLKRRELDSAEFLASSLSSVSVAGSAITGYIVHESIEELPITEEALEVLHTHETLGIVLGIVFLIILLFRIFLHFRKTRILEYLYILAFVVSTLLILIQGNFGGKLVYDFGVGVSG